MKRKVFDRISPKGVIILLSTIFISFSILLLLFTGIIGLAKLEIMASPEGYPPIGDSWRITVYRSHNNSYKPIEAIIIMRYIVDETPFEVIKSTDFEGTAFFEYRQEFNAVSFEAKKYPYQPAFWKPLSIRYIEADKVQQVNVFLLALLPLTSFYGIIITLNPFKKKEKIADIEVIILSTIILCSTFILMTYLQWQWKYAYFSSEWGYPEVLVDWMGVRLIFDNVFWVSLLLILLSMFLLLMSFGLRKYLPKRLKRIFN